MTWPPSSSPAHIRNSVIFLYTSQLTPPRNEGKQGVQVFNSRGQLAETPKIQSTMEKQKEELLPASEALLGTNCVPLGKLFHFFMPGFPHL